MVNPSATKEGQMATPSTSFEGGDENEIDLDEDADSTTDDAVGDDHDHRPAADQSQEAISENQIPSKPPPGSEEEMKTLEDASSGTETTGMTNRSAGGTSSMKDRLRLLKQKMNQARKLNQQAVQEEGQKAPYSSQRKHSSKSKASKPDPLTEQVASQAIYDAHQTAEKEALNQFSVNDYHNPQGQFRNYQRNLRSLSTRQVTANDTSTFDPTATSINQDAAVAEREGARLMAQEMRRRIEKKQKREMKRKQKELEEGDGDVSYINQRNKRFNQKINRTYDEATAEIRQNLERGTAL
ncbi:hypothetical protein ACA910_010324 [Epithemia clementina (nom. ined.)]